MQAKLSSVIIMIGLILLGVGIWQMAEVKIKTHHTFIQAKQIVNHANQVTPHKKIQPIRIGDTIGILAISRIKAELPIVEGTDPDDLKKGVGHFKGSYLPGDNGQIVLSGHRDTVFRRAGELKIGDTLIVQMSYGNFAYEITHTKIVKKDDLGIITLQHEKEELILTTCYPFRYIGNAPDRYIIYAKPKSS